VNKMVFFIYIQSAFAWGIIQAPKLDGVFHCLGQMLGISGTGNLSQKSQVFLFILRWCLVLQDLTGEREFGSTGVENQDVFGHVSTEPTC
jgi:hypothetical protein